MIKYVGIISEDHQRQTSMLGYRLDGQKGVDMITKICKLTTHGDIVNVCEYSIEPKSAMVAYLMQTIHHDYNTWQYPEIINGMRQSTLCPDNWYYDTPDGGVLTAYGYVTM